MTESANKPVIAALPRQSCKPPLLHIPSAGMLAGQQPKIRCRYRKGLMFAYAFALLAQASTVQLSCLTSFTDGSRYGSINLAVGTDYTAKSMIMTLYDPDGWTRAEVALDPMSRKLPGTLSHAFFFVPFTLKPVFPITMRGYADGKLRWQKSITTPFVPTSMVRAPAPDSGTSEYVTRADDGLPVPTPRELKFVLTDAGAKQVGALLYPVLADATEDAMSKAVVQVEANFAKRACTPPPPPLY